MMQFEAIFGIGKNELKKNCILLPLLNKDILSAFKITKFTRGKLYGIVQKDCFTLIHTGLGAPLTADAVLYLKDTPCRNVFLFGSCGLVREQEGLSLASLVAASKSYSYESFSEMLLGNNAQPKVFVPDSGLLNNFLAVAGKGMVREATCATLGSLKLEEGMVSLFIEKGIDIVDMESSAFFSACAYTQAKAAALFYATDIINKSPFYMKRDAALRSKLSAAIKNAAVLLCEFLKKN
ncbi:MAG: hypothetical protein JW788_07060 [Candidatus Omnitrophica bacterium]|nr:hypothetical protein [Candidatus Omnitrophota bacterium]